MQALAIRDVEDLGKPLLDCFSIPVVVDCLLRPHLHQKTFSIKSIHFFRYRLFENFAHRICLEMTFLVVACIEKFLFYYNRSNSYESQMARRKYFCSNSLRNVSAKTLAREADRFG